MKEVIGYVTQQSGKAMLTDENGRTLVLEKHMPVHMGDVVTTEEGSSVELILENGNSVEIDAQSRVVLDESVYKPEGPETALSEEAMAELLETGDISDLEAPAAGETAAGTSTLNVDPYLGHIENVGKAGAEVVGTAHGSETHEGVIDLADIAVLSISGPSTITEGESGEYTLSLTGVTQSDMTVTFTYSGKALEGEDYTGVGSVVIPAGASSVTFNIHTIDDNIVEGSEPFTITVDSISGGGFGIVTVESAAQSVNTNIVDNDETTVSISDVSVDEGGVATFTVTLSNPNVNEVTLDYDTSDGTAVAGVDYTAVSGTLTFAAGETSKTIQVQTSEDTIYEGPETFNVDLSNAANATIYDALGLGTITDNDAQPTISIDDVTVSEDAGMATFTVSLSNPSVNAVTVDYGTSDGTAKAGLDYTAVTGMLTFNPGETVQTITVPVSEDFIYEGPETFNVDLSNAVNASTTDVGLGTITDNDAQPTILIDDVSVNEADGNAVFTVTLSNQSAFPVTVEYDTSDGTAVAGVDYTAVSGTLTFAAGETSKTISVPVSEDVIYEGSETFNVDLSNAINATFVDDQGLGTILDNELPPTLSITGDTVGEGDYVVFTIDLDAVNFEDVTFDLHTADGTATATADYGGMQYLNSDGVWVPLSQGSSITIAAGATRAYIRVPTVYDELEEANEDFTLEATGIINTVNSTATGVGIIGDVDPFILNAIITSNSNRQTQVLRLTYTESDDETTVEDESQNSFTTLLTFESQGQAESIVHVFAFDVGFAIDRDSEYTVDLQWVSGPTTQVTDMVVEGVTVIGQTEKAFISPDIKNLGDNQGYVVSAAIIPNVGVTSEYVAYDDNTVGPNYVLVGDTGANALTGDVGNDSLYGGEGADVLEGGAGEDTATYYDSPEGVTIDLGAGTGLGGDAEGDTLSNIENVIGSDAKGYGDTLVGDANDNILMGLEGDDTLEGGAGNDTLDGGLGDDTLGGGTGDDSLIYDAEDSVIDGGGGQDTLILNNETTIDFSNLGGQSIANIEQIDLSSGGHILNNLSVEDVLGMTDANNELSILGDATSSVNLLNTSGTWNSDGSTTVIGGHEFATYTNTFDPTLTVYIEQDINDDVVS